MQFCAGILENITRDVCCSNSVVWGHSEMRLRNSFWALLGKETRDVPDVVLERIRKAMLTALDLHCDSSFFSLEVTIDYAKDVGELWYLRPELMNAICSSQSETVARKVLEEITSLFEHRHPGSTPSRFGSL